MVMRSVSGTPELVVAVTVGVPSVKSSMEMMSAFVDIEDAPKARRNTVITVATAEPQGRDRLTGCDCLMGPCPFRGVGGGKGLLPPDRCQLAPASRRLQGR